MYTHEIARRDWRRILDQLGREHTGSSLCIEVVGPIDGAHHDFPEWRLTALSIERRGQNAAVTIALARGSQTQVTHVIEHPLRMFIERSESEEIAALHIKAPTGRTTILRFRSRSSQVA